ncbi:NUDIX domain-containing protein [Dictyobacter formicarum]|uniref:NUDIX hydrolase n=1 Tax=Dictyobacter formicarum TaxID=2778368 RepID=A0ABQ3VC54_9CHLR|nr:NUDIX domain-containing protein [Dictyobacter formicarum]GHO83482.1 NUDIX hydrolase [Dictyobacter formicarum]
MINQLLLRLWKLLRGRPQWYFLWFVHSKFIVGVSGVIFDEQGRILLLRHRFWMQAAWGLPGGYANRNERLEDTLRREVLEETGYSIQVTSLIRVVSGYRLRLEASYRGTFLGGREQLDNREVLEARFFKPDELPAGLLPSQREIIKLSLSSPPGPPATTT